MFKAKYQAHKLVNIIFYIIVFLIGFYMGVMGQKIGIRDLFSKFLFIDNVEALESQYYHCYSTDDCFDVPTILDNGNSGSWDNSSYIYRMFNYYVNKFNYVADFSNFNNILVYYTSYGSSTDLTYYFSSTGFTGSLSNFSIGSSITITYNFTDNSWLIFTSPNNRTISRSYYSYTASTQENLNSNFLISYDNYYSFNENFFANNNDFKQVCVNPKNAFAISTTEQVNDYADFIWFPYNIITLQSASYNTGNSELIFSDDSDHYFFNSYDLIDKVFDSNIGLPIFPYAQNNLMPSIYPYNSRYNYYGWNAYPFGVSNMLTDNPIFRVFKFSENFITAELSDYGIAHGGGGRRHEYDLNDTTNDNLQQCFYINKVFNVYELFQDSNGNFYGTVDTPNGSIDIYSNPINDFSFFSNFNDNSHGLLSIITSPLNAINSITSGSCTPQTIPVLGKTITLPCGDTLFWNREDVQDFKIFWNMFVGGIICYFIGLSLFHKIQKFKNPTDDRVEVIDL